jgi:polyphosphate kinase 2 (PPK2 family)
VDYKRWKITEDDWRNRKKAPQYRRAIEEMLYRTSTPSAPWTVVESNSKWYARVKVLETVCQAIRKRLK